MSRLIIAMVFVLAVGSASASSSGESSIGGHVRCVHGQPLPYANVVVFGTQLGAIAREDGQFAINGVAAGAHTVQASYVGFQNSQQVVTVARSRTTPVDFVLSSTMCARDCEAVDCHRWISVLHGPCSTRVASCCFGVSSAKVSLAATAEGSRAPAPRFALEQNHPNPTKLTTAISFELGKDSPARIRIYDATGRLVRSLLDERLEAGPHTVVWDGLNEQGHRVSSGVYLYRLEATNFSAARQLVILP